MAEDFVVRSINLHKHYIAISQKYKRGGTVLFRCAREAVHEQRFTHGSSMVLKQIKNDMLLKKILKEATNDPYVKLKNKIEKTIKDATTKLINADGTWVYTTTTLHSKAINQVEDDIHLSIIEFENKTSNIIQKKANAYIEDHFKSRLKIKLLKVKKVKKVFEAGTAVVVGVGGGVMLTIFSGGTAIPGLVMGCYSSYQSCKDAVDIFRRSHKGVEDIRMSIAETVKKLEALYGKADASGPVDKKTKKKMKGREIRAAAANTFLSTNDIKSVKKLEVQVKNFAQKRAEMVVNASRIGTNVGKLNETLKKLKSAAAAIEKNAKSSEVTDILKKHKIKNLATGMTAVKDQIDRQKTTIKNLLSDALALHKKSKDYQLEIKKLELAIMQYKVNMPDSIAKANAALQGAHAMLILAPVVGGAIGGAFAKEATSGLQKIMEHTNEFIDTANTVKDHTGMKRPKLKKVKKMK